ncbi:MAG: hypothetical protein KatS3mg013_1302 [Actinomycetota bacterium]|nr:MAG: hypothetical protein KatS3mg013_1302 [Actinomycetota bacterium]
MSERTRPPRPSVRLRDGLRDAVVCAVGVRIGLAAISAVAASGLWPIPPDQPPTDAGFPPPALTDGWHVLVTATQRQDALWFLRLATHGWSPDDGSAAFFPVFPLLVRAVAWLPGIGPLGAALTVSNLACAGALVVLHGLTRLEFGDARTARRSVRLLALFPTGFFLFAPYSEAPFLMLVLLAFWWARTDRWGRAGLAGALAALTRSVGVLLVLGLAAEAVARSRDDGRPLAPRLAAAASVALGTAVWLGWWGLVHGDPGRPLDVQALWGRELWPPTRTLVEAVRLAVDQRSYWLLDVAIVGLAIVGLALAGLGVGLGRVRAGYLVWSAASLLVPLVVAAPFRPLLSAPRFAAVVFPLAWGYAGAIRAGRLSDAAVTAVFAGGWSLAAALFVAWYYVF